MHWIPIRFRLDYKLALLMFKCHKGEAPKYLDDLLSIDERTGISMSLRSYQEDVSIYRIPFTNSKTFADRSFRYGMDYLLSYGDLEQLILLKPS